MRGEGAPWDRYGIRFLADGELPRVLDLPDLPALEPVPENLEVAKHRAKMEATRQTAALVTWVAEDAKGHGIGYWHTADRVPIGEAEIIEVDSDLDFEHLPGGTLTEALCVLCGDWEDETVAPLLQECRELGIDIAVETIDDLPYMETQRPNGHRSKRYDELMEPFMRDMAERSKAKAAAELAMPSVTFTGDLAAVIGALGRSTQDGAVRAVMSLFGPSFERSEYEIGPVSRVYEVAADGHAQLIFEDGLFETAMVWIRATAEHSACASPETLVDGIGPETTREEIVARFGTPSRAGDDWDRFRAEGGFLRFGYVDGRVEEISVMRRTPGA